MAKTKTEKLGNHSNSKITKSKEEQLCNHLSVSIIKVHLRELKN